MSASEGNDPNTNYRLPVVPPGFSHSIRIGNCKVEAEAEALYYDFQVTPNSTLLYLYFAIVVEAPGHGIRYDPTFIIRISTDTTSDHSGTYLPNQIYHDTSCYMVPSTEANDGVNGWNLTVVTNDVTNHGIIAYRDWNMCCINLDDYLYRHVRIEVMISDCYGRAHFGYCYFAGECRSMTTFVNGCNAGSNDTVGIAKAPDRMSAYQWYRSRIGVTSSTDLDDYTLMPGATDSILAVHLEDFISQDGADTLLHRNTFLCKMTTYMDPTKPLYSKTLATVNNMKPLLQLDSFPDCYRNITLRDISRVVYDGGIPENQVDTSRTEWTFYEGIHPDDEPLHVDTGGTAYCDYNTAGLHCAVVRSFTRRTDTICYNEKTVQIRTFEPPTASIELSNQDICAGDSVELYNRTPDAIWHRWVLQQGDNVIMDTVTETPILPSRPYYETTHITLYTHTSQILHGDTNMDGIRDSFYCIGTHEVELRVREDKAPVPTVEIAPPYIDSENPLVIFNDVSPHSTSSLWNLGNGVTYENCCFTHSFPQQNIDSLLVTLHTCNTQNCCADTALYLPVSNFSVWFPNAFTPDLTSNNTFHIHTNNPLVDYEIHIYNRNGALVFHSTDQYEGWDGTYNNVPCPQDSYAYIATYRRHNGHTPILSKKGTVTLLR